MFVTKILGQEIRVDQCGQVSNVHSSLFNAVSFCLEIETSNCSNGAGTFQFPKMLGWSDIKWFN
jgi:hypothetical protein